MKLRDILVYPVKSMRGAAQTAAGVEPQGLAGDRRWMVTDGNGRFVTGRQLGMLVRCVAASSGDGLVLSLDGDVIDVAAPGAGAERDVTVWRDTVRARDAGDAVAAWLSERFGRALRLVWMHDPAARPLSASGRAGPGEFVSFADGYPLLAATTASLQELNTRLNDAVSMAHFRPNVVIETDEPFAEDRWHDVDIGGIPFRAASACARCVFTTVEPTSGERRADGEPLATLRDYRRDAASGKIRFGVNLVPRASGVLRVGDAVSVR